MPGDPGATVVTTLVCYQHTAHEAAGATGTRHSPRPLLGEKFVHTSGALRREIAKAYLALIARSDEFGVRSRRSLPPRNALVMPGLDPGIHHLRNESFEEGGITGSSPVMTISLDTTAVWGAAPLPTTGLISKRRIPAIDHKAIRGMI